MTYYERHLPHWQPHGAALFVTWRWHGSLPRTVETVKGQSAGAAFAATNRALDWAATGPRWLQNERVAQCAFDASSMAWFVPVARMRAAG